VAKVLAIQGRVQSQSKAHEEGLEKARRQLHVVQKFLSEKIRHAEALFKVFSYKLVSDLLQPRRRDDLT
jgi:hypothetical protein